MTPRDFAEAWKRQRDYFLSEAYLPERISALGLAPEKAAELETLFGTVLTDVLFTLLCGLDGSAGIGDIQSPYTIKDEHGNVVCSGDGTLEAEAWAVFHDND